MSAPTRRDLLRRLLGPMWLRPESALWYAHEAATARPHLGALAGRSLELGCMEAVSTFVMLGGEFGIDFDMYRDVAVADDAHRWESLQKSDWFDGAADATSPIDVVTRPTTRFSVGLSWKNSHVAKAARLGLHEQLVEHDPNRPLDMFADDEFETIWAPNLYWIDALPQLLGELGRIVRRDGRIVTVLPDRVALESMLYHWRDRADPEWIKNLDRGRHDNIARQARSLDEWHALFASHGLVVSAHERFLPRLVFQANDIGLRPLFPALLTMYAALKHSPEQLRLVKASFIDVCFEMLAPMCDVEWMQRAQMPEVWHLFVLGRSDA